MARMAREGIAVEINLTSNDVILGVKGEVHPLGLYRRHGVPFVLSTDDAGVLRSDMTAEYVRAVREQGLSYRDLKQASRNSLTYSFLPPAEKAQALAQLEAQWDAFERERLATKGAAAKGP
jgi:adenosine deaminase